MSSAIFAVLQPLDRFRKSLVCLCLILLTAALYAPVWHHEFVNYDDQDYMTENPHLLGGLTAGNVAWAFTTFFSSNWHPLTWISHMLDADLWGVNAGGQHITSVIIHTANAVLLFLVFKAMTGSLWRSAFIAAVFAWHPLHVESVAWISERKDVLSGFFWIATMGAYVRYVRQPNWQRYLLALFLFACGLMSKPMLVTLPAVLLLLDYWPLARGPAYANQPSRKATASREATGRRAPAARQRVATATSSVGDEGETWLALVAEKIPFFALSAISCVLTILAQREGGSIAAIENLPLLRRLTNAVTSYAAYITDVFWPSRLAVFYPFPESIPAWQVAGSIVLLASVTGVAVALRRRAPWLLVGWFWYLGSLVPVIGIVQVGDQAMADRYMYVPVIGLSIFLAWAVPQLCNFIFSSITARRMALVIASAAALIACATVTAKQLPYWRNSITLYQRALAVTSGRKNLVHNNYGTALARRGEADAAISEFRAALAIWPNYALAMQNLAVTLLGRGDVKEALPHFNAALKLAPQDAKLRFQFGTALLRNNQVDEAIKQLEESLRLDPSRVGAHTTLGVAYDGTKRIPEAIEQYNKALQLQPDLYVPTNNLGWIRATNADPRIRNGAEALRLAQHAAKLSNQADPEALDTLAAALAETGQTEQAVKVAEHAQKLARETKRLDLADQIARRLEFYRQGKPYHQSE